MEKPRSSHAQAALRSFPHFLTCANVEDDLACSPCNRYHITHTRRLAKLSTCCHNETHRHTRCSVDGVLWCDPSRMSMGHTKPKRGRWQRRFARLSQRKMPTKHTEHDDHGNRHAKRREHDSGRSETRRRGRRSSRILRWSSFRTQANPISSRSAAL